MPGAKIDIGVEQPDLGLDIGRVLIRARTERLIGVLGEEHGLYCGCRQARTLQPRADANVLRALKI
jgi:hypothetical protein